MAVIAKQRYKLDIAPKGGWVIVYASQHDNGAREIEFEITNQGNAYSIPASINISVQGVKSNKGYFSHSCSYTGNIVKMALANDMTDVIGKAICVLKFTNSSQQKLATAKFILNVDSDSSSEGVIIDTEAEEIFNQMLNEIRAQAASVSADIAELQSMVGSPLVASTASAMADHNKIYVYTGSQSGYTNGNWYYWNGSAWTSGGVYNSVAVNVDSVPTAGSTNAVQSGGVKSVLDGLYAEIPIVDSVPIQGSSNAVSSGGVWDVIEEKGGLSEDAKVALLACFEHVAWVDEHGQDYYDALESALYPEAYWDYEWDASSGTLPEGMTASAYDFTTEVGALYAENPVMDFDYIGNQRVVIECKMYTINKSLQQLSYRNNPQITLTSISEQKGCKLIGSFGNATTNPDGNLTIGINGVNTILSGAEGMVMHEYDLTEENGTCTLSIDGTAVVLTQNQGTSQYLRVSGIFAATLDDPLYGVMVIKSLKYKKL